MDKETIGPRRAGHGGEPMVAERKFGGELIDHRQLGLSPKARERLAPIESATSWLAFGSRGGITAREAGIIDPWIWLSWLVTK